MRRIGGHSAGKQVFEKELWSLFNMSRFHLVFNIFMNSEHQYLAHINFRMVDAAMDCNTGVN